MRQKIEMSVAWAAALYKAGLSYVEIAFVIEESPATVEAVLSRYDFDNLKSNLLEDAADLAEWERQQT